MEFATSVHCMDGRIQEPVLRFIKKNYNARYVDIITEPGPCQILLQGPEHPLFESICRRVSISTQKHGSNILFISGHHDCAGNDVSKECQVRQLEEGEVHLRNRFPNLQIVKLWIDKNWNFETV